MTASVPNSSRRTIQRLRSATHSLRSYGWSRARRGGNSILYGLLFALGIAAMPGPTLLLMLILAAPYLGFSRIAQRREGEFRPPDPERCCMPLVRRRGVAGRTNCVYRAQSRRPVGQRSQRFLSCARARLAGIDIMSSMPFGAGLTGEPFIQDRVTNLYLRSPAYSPAWPVVHPASELLINYFWLHWIYLGLVPGLILIAAISYWLTTLGVPSPAFCWVVWAILGQASGAYVGPTCWGVLFLAAAVAVLNQRTTSKTWLLKAVD